VPLCQHSLTEFKHQNFVDDMNDAIRLQNIGDCDARGVAFRIGDVESPAFSVIVSGSP